MNVRSQVAAVLLCAAASGTSSAQAVYKCGAGSYSEMPCSRRVISTADAPVPATRRHRARMLQTDRDECARLDTRRPVEEARAASLHADEASEARASLNTIAKRARQLKC